MTKEEFQKVLDEAGPDGRIAIYTQHKGVSHHVDAKHIVLPIGDDGITYIYTYEDGAGMGRGRESILFADMSDAEAGAF